MSLHTSEEMRAVVAIARTSPLSADATDAMRWRVLFELLPAPRTVMLHGDVVSRYTIDVPAQYLHHGRLNAWIDAVVARFAA